MKPSPAQLTIGAAAFTALVGGILYGVLSPDSDGRRVSVPWPDGGVPASVECIETTGLASEQALQLFQLDTNAGRYAQTVLCYDASVDAGDEAELPGGMVAIADTQRMVEYVPGMPQFFAALQGEPENPCACNTGSDCLRPDGGPAPMRQTLAAGSFIGDGCFRKVCVEVAGTTSWPPECGPE